MIIKTNAMYELTTKCDKGLCRITVIVISNLGIIKGINHNENKVRCVSQLFRKGLCVARNVIF